MICPKCGGGSAAFCACAKRKWMENHPSQKSKIVEKETSARTFKELEDKMNANHERLQSLVKGQMQSYTILFADYNNLTYYSYESLLGGMYAFYKIFGQVFIDAAKVADNAGYNPASYYLDDIIKYSHSRKDF